MTGTQGRAHVLLLSGHRWSHKPDHKRSTAVPVKTNSVGNVPLDTTLQRVKSSGTKMSLNNYSCEDGA